jgi:hypothetical protein
MVSRHLMGEPMPPEGARPGEQVLYQYVGKPQELLLGIPVPGSTTLAGRGGPQDLLSGERVFGSNRLAVWVRMLIAHYRAEVRGALAHQDVRLPQAWAPT